MTTENNITTEVETEEKTTADTPKTVQIVSKTQPKTTSDNQKKPTPDRMPDSIEISTTIQYQSS